MEGVLWTSHTSFDKYAYICTVLGILFMRVEPEICQSLKTSKLTVFFFKTCKITNEEAPSD